jgi:aryl-alcohol dehydrogenase-like predicted oxidoreductase
MKYAKLGNSDLNVSRICLGCMGFGNAATGQHSWTVAEEDTREIVKHALELEVNFFDTAIAYQNGTSEEFLGRALRAVSIIIGSSQRRQTIHCNRQM